MPTCIIGHLCSDEPCDEPMGGHAAGISTQLGRATCRVHLGLDAASWKKKKRGREDHQFVCSSVGRLSRVKHPTLKRVLENGRCKKRWPSDKLFGWKFPHVADNDAAAQSLSKHQGQINGQDPKDWVGNLPNH